MTFRSTRAFFLVTFCAALAVQSVHAQSADPSAQDSNASDNSSKVWTNDNIKSVRGQINVVGGSGGDERDTNGEFAERSHGARFVSPSPGELVSPGQSVRADIALDSGISLSSAALVSPMNGVEDPKYAPPYSFVLSIPDKEVDNGPLIGLQSVSMMGRASSRSNGDTGDPILATTFVDVEEREMPTSMYVSVMGNGLNAQRGLQLYGVGAKTYLNIFAKFPNGREWEVTRSTYVQLDSSTPSIARFDKDKGLIAVQAGIAHLVVTYTRSGESKTLAFDATVNK